MCVLGTATYNSDAGTSLKQENIRMIALARLKRLHTYFYYSLPKNFLCQFQTKSRLDRENPACFKNTNTSTHLPTTIQSPYFPAGSSVYRAPLATILLVIGSMLN